MTAPHQPTAAAALDGALPLGDYALEGRVERRAAADVYAATHVPTGEPRLVYVLHAAAAQDNPLVHQVVCEIDAARWLRHPATAKVDAHGETPTGAPYVAVQRPRGRTLAQVLAAGERPGRRRFVRLANRLVEALDEAHAVGLVHGRLTPSALVVGDERDEFDTPPLTVTGFGVAALAHDGAIGPDERPYVAPEVQAGGAATERSDVFALASVLHHLLVGTAPGTPGAPAPAADGAGAGSHASAVAVLAAARAADPAHRSRSVKAFWEELVAALVDDAAAVDATAAPAPVATPAPARTSGEVAVRTLLEQLEHERRLTPRADVAKATLLSPMPGAAAPVAAAPAAVVPASPAVPPAVRPAAPPATAAGAHGAPPVAEDPWAGSPSSATGSAALAALAAFSAPTAPAPTMPGAPPPPAAPSLPTAPGASVPAAPLAPAGSEAPAAPVPRRSRPAPVAWSDELPPERAIPDLPPARSGARLRPRPGFLLAVGVGAPLAFLAVINWPGPMDAAPLVDPDPPAVIAIRAAMAVDAAKDRRARQAMSGRARAADADADVAPDADSLPADTLPTVAPIVIPSVTGLEVPAVRAAGAAPVGREEFRRMRVAAPDSLR